MNPTSRELTGTGPLKTPQAYHTICQVLYQETMKAGALSLSTPFHPARTVPNGNIFEPFHLNQSLYPKHQPTVWRHHCNLSLQGYVVANPVNGEGQIPGQFRLTFSGVIDKYHSDILRNDTSTPSWLRTVGFNNNSENIGYTNTTSGSTGSHLMGSLPLTVIVSALWLVI